MEELDYDEYEKKEKVIQDENAEYLKWFEEDLQSLSEKTRRNHMNNVEFYLNEFLAYRCEENYRMGIKFVSEYFGYFFVRKCMWSSPATIRSTAASIKKFYKCMVKHQKITPEEYEDLCWIIKCEMDDWCQGCDLHDSRF